MAACSYNSKSFQRSPGRHADRLTQAWGILARDREIMVTLEARNRLTRTIVKDTACSDRPVTEFVEDALHSAQLPQRTHDVGVRIGAQRRRCALRTRARQWNRIALLRRFGFLRVRRGRSTPQQLSRRPASFAGQHRERPDRKNRRGMPPGLQVQAVRDDRRDRSHER